MSWDTGGFFYNMKDVYKEELQSIYEMSLSKDTEAKDLAISLFWTSEYVKDNENTLKQIAEKSYKLSLK